MRRSVVMLSIGLAVAGLASGAWASTSGPLDPAKVAAAHTPAEHEAIAKAYEAEAVQIEKMSSMHKNLSETYAQPGGKPWQGAQAKHCDSVAASLKAAAEEERALAAEHRKLAMEAGH